MRPSSPPRLATWMLENMVLDKRNEALAGDLLEEFHCGRSAAWYWRQVFAAIIIANTRQIFAHLTILIFAIFWSMLSPAWILVVANLEQYYHFNDHILQMDWPWSVFSDFGLLLAANLIFIWAGILVYLATHLAATRSFKPHLLGRGILTSIPIIIVIWVALLFFPKHFLQSRQVVRPAVISLHSYALSGMASSELAHIRTVRSTSYGNPRYAIADARPEAILVRLPFFLCVLYALWGTTRWDSAHKRFVNS